MNKEELAKAEALLQKGARQRALEIEARDAQRKADIAKAECEEQTKNKKTNKNTASHSSLTK